MTYPPLFPMNPAIKYDYRLLKIYEAEKNQPQRSEPKFISDTKLVGAAKRELWESGLLNRLSHSLQR